MFQDKFGNAPIETLTLNSLNAEQNINLQVLESVSFYFLNVIKNKEKETYFTTSNLKERLTWINNQYERAIKHSDNPSLAMNFFDLEIAGMPKDHMKATIFLFIGLLFLFIAYKFRIMNI